MPFSLLKDLNSQQRKAITFSKGPLSVLAGAGSGKTRVLTYRAAWLILEKGVNPENLLLVTFTNKAAEEMKKRIKNLLGAKSFPLTATFHSFCAKLLRKEGKYINIPPSFVIYDNQDQKDLIKQILKDLDLSSTKFNPGLILYTISSAKNELISAIEYPQYVRGYFQETVAQIYLRYQRLLKEFQALDFDDLLFESVNLFKKNLEIAKKYQNLFSYILVDEYQDTNHAQYELTKILAKKWRNLTVVGDASQSIYRWRGADFRNLSKLKEDFPDLTIINLERNYRSPQIILDAAFAVINKNTGHPILKLWTDKESIGKIKVYQAKNERDESLFIANNIYQMKDKKLSFAILYRTNAQSRPIEELLLKLGIPYQLIGGVRFYERKEIKDCLAYLRLLANPKDMNSYKRLEKLGKRRLKKFIEYQEKIKKKLKKMTTLDILNSVLKKTGYLELFNEKNEEDLARLENIKELTSVASEFPNLDQFLENVALVQQEFLPDKQPKNSPENQPVVLMTLHAAKGLEFDVVFMIGMEEGLFPHSRSMLEKEELEEERRLCYVGITRAKKQLFFTYAKNRLYFGSRNYNQISRFISDLPESLLELETPSLLFD